MIITILISLQLTIFDHRFKELKNREEIIANYIIRENYVSSSEAYIFQLIKECSEPSIERFMNIINDNFTKQSFSEYEFIYEKVNERFLLTIRSTGGYYYYRLIFENFHPKLIELTY